MTLLLITGAAGFFGHHLVEHVLHNTDWEIVCLDGLSYAGNLERLRDIECLRDVGGEDMKRLRFVWHDLRSPISDSVSNRIGQVDYVVHTAAETHVDRSLEDSVPFVMSNVLGTCHLLEWVRHQQPGLKKYIQFSTDEVFGAAPPGVDHKEWDPHRPSNPYAAAKAGADDLAYSFAHAYKLPIIITHTMNLFGERQHPEKFIPMTIRKIMLGETVVIHGLAGSVSTRKWIHCRNAAGAILFLLREVHPGEFGGKYNIVGEEHTVQDVAMAIAQMVGRPLKHEYLDFHSTRPGHDLRYSLDGTRLAEMGWVPAVSFHESLHRVVLWSVERKHWLGL